MSRTINNLNEFKSMATLTYDNRSVASKNWSKTWGMGWWMDLWHYKEYSIGCLKYRTGKVYFRHYSKNVTKFYVDDKEVSRAKFFELASAIEYIPKNVVVNAQPNKPQHQQLSLFDEVV